MKKYILSLLLLVSMAHVASAQAPGFQGKRFSIGYNFAFFPDVLHGSDYTYANVNMHHSLELNYVVNMNRTIGISYRFSNPTVNMSYVNNYDPYGYYTTDNRTISGKGRMFVHTFGFETKLFNKPYIAPNGSYGKLGVDFIYYTSKLTEGRLDATENQTAPSGFDVALKFGLGRQYVVAKRMTIDFGFDVGLPLRSTFTYASTGLGNQGFGDNEARHRLFQESIMQLHVGLGFLAF